MDIQRSGGSQRWRWRVGLIATVAENVALPLTYRSGVKAADIKLAVATALSRMNIDHRASHLPIQLSGGQRARDGRALLLAT